jgi:hypothetical protein
MDFVSAFKSEIFRPIVSLVIPGFFAIAPYIIVTGCYVPIVRSFWTEYPSAFVAIVIICILAGGLILENLGTFIEDQWDKKLIKGDTNHNNTWSEYLKLELKDEIIGQRYLRVLLTWMKFELSMTPALLSFWVGLLWVNYLYEVWSCIGFVMLSIFIFAVVGYLLNESYKSAKNLAKIRRLIVEAVKTKPVSKEKTSALESN